MEVVEKGGYRELETQFDTEICEVNGSQASLSSRIAGQPGWVSTVNMLSALKWQEEIRLQQSKQHLPTKLGGH